MPFEAVRGLNVIDEAGYEKYREAMTPILARYGGGFRFDFIVAKTLKADAPHPINRVFAIYFADRASKDAFFADPAYKQVRATYFEPAVRGVTLIGEYDR